MQRRRMCRRSPILESPVVDQDAPFRASPQGGLFVAQFHPAIDEQRLGCPERCSRQFRADRTVRADATRPSRRSFPGRNPIDSGSGFLHHLLMGNSRARIVDRLLDFRPEPLVMFALFVPAPDECAHKLAYQLRGWLVHSGCLGNKCIPQFGLKLNGENSFLGHGVQLQW